MKSLLKTKRQSPSFYTFNDNNFLTHFSVIRGLKIAGMVIFLLVSRSFAQVKLQENKVGKSMVADNATMAFLTKNDNPKQIITDLQVKGYPNPFINEINFAFATPVKGQARLQLFNAADGKRIAYIIVKRMSAQKACTLTYNIPSEQRVPLIYKLTIGGKTATGQLTPAENVSIR